MAERGIAMVIVSHNMEHLWSVCNRVVVFRRGRKVADLPKKGTTAEEVVSYITGAHVAAEGL
jgi:ABC-type sugar transport system ATPase subunit